MEPDEFGERQSIRDSARQLKKYGSTCNHVRNNDYLIRHNLQQTDTLQGIALKYGCTTEQIRRANRLFAQDSLFLRQYLMIPVDRNASVASDEHPMDAAASTSQSGAGPPSGVALRPKRDRHDDNVLSPEEESKKSIEDFLGKIDSTLAKSKSYVRNSQSNSNSLALFDDNAPAGNTHSAAASSPSSYQSGTSYNSSDNRTQQTVVSQGNRLRSTQTRLEKQQDDFYQL